SAAGSRKSGPTPTTSATSSASASWRSERGSWPSVAQVALEEGAELRGHHHAAHQLAALGVIGTLEHGAVGEPERQPVARVAEGLGARPPHRAAHDHLHERLD